MEHKFLLPIFFIMLLFVGCPANETGTTTADNGPAIKSVKLYDSTVMEKTDYNKGEELSLSGVRLKVTYVDGVTDNKIYYSSEPESFFIPDITQLDVGSHKITCKYRGVDFEVTINIYPARTKNEWETTALADLSPNINHDFWDNANVYFVITDRFYNGDQDNDTSYGRVKGNPKSASDATKFYGGDIKGLTAKLDYLEETGIDAIWITAPYEQIHGDTGGSYPYHGYWALDWTQMDANMGTAEEFRTFVDEAHKKGIRVVMDVVMNHPGYGTYEDFKNLVSNGGDLLNGTTINHKSCELHNWWGIDWLRAGLCTHYTNGTGTLKGSCGSYLPDFITESAKGVSLPEMFTRKLADTTNYPREGYQITDLTNDASESGNYRMRDYMIKWLSDWVREFGIDGFRCDTAKHVEKEAWYQLKVACTKALRDWKTANPSKVIPNSGDFWMTGEVNPHQVKKDTYFTEGGFDSLLNISSFRTAAGSALSDMKSIEQTYLDYASAFNTDETFNMLSFISFHDTDSLFYDKYAKTTDKQNAAGSLLAFCPGAIQIYYGDECGRKKSSSSDAEQQTRSQMPWNEDGYNNLGYQFDSDIHAHWSKVLNFRKKHVAVGAGAHTKIKDAPYTFSRVKGSDKVIVVLGASGSVEVDVSSIGASSVKDYYTGTTVAVTNGKATFTADSNGVILIEAAE